MHRVEYSVKHRVWNDNARGEFLLRHDGSASHRTFRPGVNITELYNTCCEQQKYSSGALEFVPAMVYPERSRVLIMDADGIQVQEGPKELPWTENAADVLPNYPFISGECLDRSIINS